MASLLEIDGEITTLEAEIAGYEAVIRSEPVAFGWQTTPRAAANRNLLATAREKLEAVHAARKKEVDRIAREKRAIAEYETRKRDLGDGRGFER
jgi:hypothetical protein